LTAIAAAGVAVEDAINTLIGRAGPAGGSSFPSGHTTMATSVRVCLCVGADIARLAGADASAIIHLEQVDFVKT
jgi:membrane-associated phospholipid phosphatase